jgi:hypothetical protein
VTTPDLDPKVLAIRPAMNGVLYLLIVHADGEITEYDLGQEIAWEPERDPVEFPSPRLMARAESPWVTLSIRWWCSICSAHHLSDPDCPRCAAGQWTETQFAIWKATGDVYRVGDDGAVGDDPWMRGKEVESRLRRGTAR